MFPEDGLKFIDELALNNNREWFTENKARYKKNVEAPAIELVEKLGQKLQETISADIQYDTRANGAGSLMRIYRDIRFSEDKTPYKTHVDMYFWEGDAKKMQNPGFGFRVEAGGNVGLLAGCYGFTPDVLKIYRRAVDDDTLGKELIEAVEAVKNAGDYRVEGEHYKRVPKGYDKDHPRERLLRYAGLRAFSPPLNPDLLTSPALVDEVIKHFKAMSPVQQ